MRANIGLVVFFTSAASLLGGGCGDDEFVVTPLYDPTTTRAQVELSRGLSGSEQIHMRVRRGSFGTLDCATQAPSLPTVTDAAGKLWFGPVVPNELTKPFYNAAWAATPTAEMLAQVKLGTDSIIDVCVMDGTKVVKQIEADLFQAWDAGRQRGLGGKADDPNTGEQRINSAQEYGVRCIAELGEIPFFEKVGELDYGTYDCLNSTPIPMTVTDANGNVDNPSSEVSKCDNPQYIYSLCEPGPRVATRINDQGTRWTLLCRKSIGGYASNQYNDIAMIGNNPFTGKTCFFQNALYSKTDGAKIPHPADKNKSTNLWSGVHGGRGSGIQCADCHDADPFIHSPWIDGAKDVNGRSVVPKMGVDPDYAIGANDAPYSLINLAGQGWTMPRQIVSVEANKCLSCHRMGDGRWTNEWLQRLNGTDSTWNGITSAKYLESQHKYWMPNDRTFASDADFNDSEYGKALAFMLKCGDNHSDSACRWQDIPATAGGNSTGGKLRNPVTLGDAELAAKASTILGMNRNAQSQVCAECHAPTETTLRDWQEKTAAADASCFATGGSVPRTASVDKNLSRGDFTVIGTYEVASGASINIKMTGDGDGDLYVKRGAEVSEQVYDCRPYGPTSAETCGAASQGFNATGPATFYIGAKGYSDAHVKIEVTYGAPGGSAPEAKDIVSCLRLDPTRADAPFSPSKAGIYAAAAHLGWFQDTFKAAYPADGAGNNADTWALEYGKFKNRVSMPKGNHPRLTQDEFDIVAEWFVRGLPQVVNNLPVQSGPNSCTPSVSAAVPTHVANMATNGWSAANRDAGLSMFGCNGANNPLQCLTNFPAASDRAYGTNWTPAGTTLRVLRELNFHTFFWMRSSADGRFVANGATGGTGSMISDLQADKDIPVHAAYDPGFFPDNRGWVFQGTPIGAAFCTTGLLTSGPASIGFTEPQCSSVEGVSLYQHLGAGLNGGDYFVINGQFTSDNPSASTSSDPSSGFGATANIKLTPMVFDGTRFTGKPSITVPSPNEGDSVLSPSTQLVVSRFGGNAGQLGYVLRKVNATANGNSYAVTTPEVARYCTTGGKPAISYDEKFMVLHHYETNGSANIRLVNLATGAVTQVTNMNPGQQAIFPHFRSDGWIYFLVRDRNSNKEYVVASDAALRL